MTACRKQWSCAQGYAGTEQIINSASQPPQILGDAIGRSLSLVGRSFQSLESIHPSDDMQQPSLDPHRLGSSEAATVPIPHDVCTVATTIGRRAAPAMEARSLLRTYSLLLRVGKLIIAAA